MTTTKIKLTDETITMTVRTHLNAYAVVMPPPDGRLRPTLTRLAYGLWPAGFPGEVVGVIIDAGTGVTEADIHAALTVTALDPVFASHVAGCATDHVWCEMDRIRAGAPNTDPLCGYSPDEIVVGPAGQTLTQATTSPSRSTP